MPILNNHSQGKESEILNLIHIKDQSFKPLYLEPGHYQETIIFGDTTQPGPRFQNLGSDANSQAMTWDPYFQFSQILG